jgi:hypothetical protein
MNLTYAESITRAARASTWLGSLAGFAATLRGSVQSPGQLLIVGSPDAEPWHFTAHLDNLARFRGARELTPTLVRWQHAERGAPGISATDMATGGHGRVILAIDEGVSDDALLERLADARRHGATVLGLSGADPSSGGSSGSLDDVAHEAHTVRPGNAVTLGRVPVVCDFELATHLVGVTAVTPPSRRRFLRRA